MSNITKRNDQGFTIVELMISILISMLILGGALKLFYMQRKSFSVQEQLSEMQQNLRGAMEMISRDIRMAGYGTTSTNIFSVSESGTITFFSDIDNDTNLEQITFGLKLGETPKLTRNTQPVANNIEALSFVYGTDVTTGATNTVTVTLIARTDKSDPNYMGDGFRRETLTSFVKIRALQ